MNSPEIILRPTPWFFWRAILLLVMLLGGGLYFIYDYQVGYPKKNVHYFSHKQFQNAHDLYSAKKNQGLTDAEWVKLATNQTTPLAPEGYPLPEGQENQFTWPQELADPELMKAGFSPSWLAYTARMGWDEKPAEKPKDQRTVNEQLYFGTGALILSVVPLFFLIRTSRRQMSLIDGTVSAPDGTTARISDIKRIDLRKWKTKGLARLEASDSEGDKTLRLDGLAYGGFKKEQDEPAERFMQAILKDFDGEIIEYEEEIDEDESTDESDEALKA